MIQWLHPIKPFTTDDAMRYNQESYWTTFTIGIRNMPTIHKLDHLDAYYYNRVGLIGSANSYSPPRNVEVQIDSYIAALKSTGFLNDQLQVVK